MTKGMKYGIAFAGIGILTLVVTGCSSLTESYNDAPVDHKVDSPAVIFSMPDGFGNYAEKCDESGHLVVTTRLDSRDVSIVTDHAACPRAGVPVTLSKQK